MDRKNRLRTAGSHGHALRTAAQSAPCATRRTSSVAPGKTLTSGMLSAIDVLHPLDALELVRLPPQLNPWKRILRMTCAGWELRKAADDLGAVLGERLVEPLNHVAVHDQERLAVARLALLNRRALEPTCGQLLRAPAGLAGQNPQAAPGMRQHDKLTSDGELPRRSVPGCETQRRKKHEVSRSRLKACFLLGFEASP